jgi:hypothetical protein
MILLLLVLLLLLFCVFYSIDTNAQADEGNPTIPIMCAYNYHGKYGRTFVSGDDPSKAIKTGAQG